ncbi:hypothetical protein ACVWYG_001986 [Pedobacter sp. UYEF25]
MTFFKIIFIAAIACLAPSAKSDHLKAESSFVHNKIYNMDGVVYKSYTGLVMAGYQGWFAANGDGSGRGWYHYQGSGGFFPGTTNVDFWPDITEYAKKYKSPFKFANGSDAYLYSPYDEDSVDLHFKWMKEYGIDGVHMQRFIAEIKSSNVAGKRHFNKVLANALKAAKKYGRAISIMYDLSGCSSADVAYLEQDWNEVQRLFKLFDSKENPTYLYHNGKPLVSIWGVGFNDNRQYSISDVSKLVTILKGPFNKVAIMLGVPYYWRSLGKDTEKSLQLHELIKKVDLVMPWAVGRFNSTNYNEHIVYDDIEWCKANKIDYIPLVFPGFSWGNMHKDASLYSQIPRLKGDFLWQQIAGAKNAGAKSLYVAMFDEIDEGTAIFKTTLKKDTPLNGDEGLKFVGIDDDLASDYYLWLTGQGANWFHGANGFTNVKPKR